MEKTLRTADGKCLHVLHWPTAEPARGTVLIVHDLGEHIGRWGRLATQLRVWGWHAVGYDQRGHGWSSGARGALAGDDTLLEDLGAMVSTCRAQLPTPIVLLGHGLDGLVAARFVAEGLTDMPAGWWSEVDGLALSSPAFDGGARLPQHWLVSAFGRLTPSHELSSGLEAADVSRDPETIESYRNDAQVHDHVTPRLLRFLARAGLAVQEAAPRWIVPTLLLYAGADRCVDPAGSSAFAAAAPAGVVSARGFPPLYHELFNEPERADVVTALGVWLLAQER